MKSKPTPPPYVPPAKGKKSTPPPYVPPAKGRGPTPPPYVPPIQSGPVRVMPNGPFGVGGGGQRNRGEPVPPIQSGPASNFRRPVKTPPAGQPPTSIQPPPPPSTPVNPIQGQPKPPPPTPPTSPDYNATANRNGVAARQGGEKRFDEAFLRKALAEYNAQKPNDGRQVSQDMVDSRYFGKDGLSRASQGFDAWFTQKYDTGAMASDYRNNYNPYQGYGQTGAGIPFSQSSGMQAGGLGIGGMQNPQLEAMARANAALASQYRNQSGYPVPQASQYSLATPDMEQKMYGDMRSAQAKQYAQQQAMIGQERSYPINQADPRLIDPAKRKQFGY